MEMNTSTKNWDRSYETKAVILLAITFGVLSFDRWLVAPLFPVIMKDLNLDYQSIGNLFGILAVSWGIFSAIFGGVSDRVGRRKILIPAIVGFSIFSGLVAFAQGFVTLLMFRALMGIVEGGYTPVAIASTFEASHPKRAGLNIGIQQCTFALIGLAFGPLIATQMLKVLSWRYIFGISVVPGLICAYLCYKVIREPSHFGSNTESEKKTKWSEVFKYRNVNLNMIGLLGIMSFFFVMAGMTPVYLTDHLKLSMSEMGFATSAIGFGGFIGSLGLPALSDRIGRKPALYLCFVIGIVCILIYMNTGKNVPLLFVLLFLMAACGFGNLIMNTAVIPTESVPPELRSSAPGLPIAIGEVFGGGVAPVFAGYIAMKYGLYSITYLMVVGWIFASIVLLFLKETAPIKLAKKEAKRMIINEESGICPHCGQALIN